MPADPSEQRFVERLRRRDERAFNELVEAYQDRVFSLVQRMLGRREEAEDVAQEVFVQVFKSIDQFRGDSKLGTWIYRIAVNLSKNRIQHLSRRASDREDELEPLADRGSLDAGSGVTTGAVALQNNDRVALPADNSSKGRGREQGASPAGRGDGRGK